MATASGAATQRQDRADARSTGGGAAVMMVFGVLTILCVLLFFSSRRRHTRFDCDWSSDVCSSDLPLRVPLGYLRRLEPLDFDFAAQREGDRSLGSDFVRTGQVGLAEHAHFEHIDRKSVG